VAGQRYGDVARLNAAWGTVFWSQEYRSFEEVDPPNLTVTEAHPEHRLDYARFSSDAVASFNREQVNLLRPARPGRDLLHNFHGLLHRVRSLRRGARISMSPPGTATRWASPSSSGFSDDEKARFRRQGHPDIAGFHHDLYRGCGRGRMWVMEQQPGPVNWAAYNPAPLPGMVRAWTWEAFAHGAEVVSYFRWRQAPFGQEQMHAGLQRPDRTDAGRHGPRFARRPRRSPRWASSRPAHARRSRWCSTTRRTGPSPSSRRARASAG
jgi:beta-galactosidase